MSNINLKDVDFLELQKINLLNKKSKYLNLQIIKAVCFLLSAIAIAVVLSFVFMPLAKINTDNLENKLSTGDIVLTFNQFGNYSSGDLVVLHYQNIQLCKRVVAGSGDFVDFTEKGQLVVNDIVVDEPYVLDSNLRFGEFAERYPYQVPDGQYFVLSDNRSVLSDSRNLAIDCIDKDKIIGKVLICVFPMEKFGLVD